MSSFKRILSLLVSLCAALSIMSPRAEALSGVVYSGNSDCGKRIALTFDDGPGERTPEILALLDKYGIKATFFVVGNNVERFPETVALEIEKGHEIGNHSYSHVPVYKCGTDKMFEELDRMTALLKTFGYTLTLFRPPEGNCCQELVSGAIKRGYRVVLWTVDPRDWAKTPADVMVQNAEKYVSCGSILLFHDFTSSQAHTVEALEVLIPRLIGRGYEFVTVSQLLG